MRALTLALMLAALALPARAQAPITVVVNFVAGGPSDLMARLMAPELSQQLGVPVVVKNSVGAAGTIGAAEVARARPDGQTLLLSPVGAMAVQPHFRRDLPYRPTDLVGICQVADTPVVVMAAPNGPATLREALARAREAGAGFNYASTGPGSIPHIATADIARRAGIGMTHIPFRGNAEAVMALLRGDVTLFADQPGTIRANGLRALAVMAPARSPEFPDTPTTREEGLDLVYSIWSGLFAPAGTPDAFLARAEAACQRAMVAPAVVEGFARLATPITFRGREAFARFWAEELEKFRGIVESAGLRPGD
ncbi:Bug family tripartite tricarboxylate transporter substrate binding protein [Sabulicella glaciei]|uniref:Tripartite tricarboxylate transporter substrate binding protein n=1 Tax=Sabulicella glaciei TaxID=2984948 RepID=A0ABT3NXK9_9PROT|nr:tripartite tricarboxylate transporter substrate binding protein [Roseococcus sp. MDT2-1-1]MCW8086901.1 tripartite tricarboxylate transporter substrate binding protein [Roseococcus sp. MDT2-1-1]